MTCKKCGSEINPNDKFCQKCGEKVVAASSDVLATVNDDKRFTVRKPVGDDIGSQNALLKSVWPDWTVVQKLGEGSFGKVYKAERTEMGNKFYSAIKIITVPQNSSEAETISAEVGYDAKSTTAYFKALVDDCVNEIKMMESFKGIQNIVSVEDYKVVPHEGSFGWTIFIRMELLTSFVSYSKAKTLTEKDVIKLGIDICSALECCARLNVMHRDIKPENIFVSNFGDFKLGDFGIARKLEKSTAGMSKKGTYNYMAPEVYSGKGKYDFQSDIYSLGIVLYKLMNNNRFPLIDPVSTAVTYQQMDAAFTNRMAGARLGKPINASAALSNVILAACAYNPQERFATASAMKAALINIQSGKADVPVQAPVPAKADNNNAANAGSGAKADAKAKPEKKKKKEKKEKKKMSKGKKALIIILLIFILLGGGAGYLQISYYMGAEYKIMKALENEDYNAAIEVYKESDGDASDLLVKKLEERLEKTKTDFIAGTIDYSVANMEVSTIQKMGIDEISGKVKEVSEYINKLNDSQTAFSTAETMFAKADYVGAMENYKKVIEDDANYESAKTKLSETAGKYREQVLAKAAEYVTAGSYAKAIAELESALKVLPDDSQISAQLESYKSDSSSQIKSEAIQTAANAAATGDYITAIQTLEAAIATYPNDVEISTDLDTYKTSYVTSVIATADSFVASRDYLSAIAAVTDALAVLPGNQTLIDKQTALDNNRPLVVATLTPINGGFTWNDGDPTDPFQVTHSDAGYYSIIRGGDESTSYAEYRVYGKYKTLTASVVPHSEIAQSARVVVKVYADDTLVYTSKEIGRKTDKFEISANVAGADYVKIVVEIKDNRYNASGHNALIFMDPQLWTE